MCHRQTTCWYFDWRLKDLNHTCRSFSIESSRKPLTRKKFFRKSFFLHSEDSPSKVVHKTVEKIIRQLPNFFKIFLKSQFFVQRSSCAQHNPPLTLSDRAEIFTRDTQHYSPDVKSTVFIYDLSIQIYRVFKVGKPVFPRSFSYFINKKKSK